MHEYHEKSTSVIDVSEAKVTLSSSLYIMPLVELQINRLDLIMNKSSMSEFHWPLRRPPKHLLTYLEHCDCSNYFLKKKNVPAKKWCLRLPLKILSQSVILCACGHCIMSFDAYHFSPNCKSCLILKNKSIHPKIILFVSVTFLGVKRIWNFQA